MRPPILDAFQANLKAGEYVKFVSESSDGLGEIIRGNQDTVTLRVFKAMDSTTLQSYFLRPNINEDDILEVYQSSDEIEVERTAIVDVAFILPVEEMESGMFFLSGAENTFYIRYIFLNNTLCSARSSLYFARYLVEPLSIRLFINLNTLAHHLRKALFHQRESSISKKSFRLPLFSMEAFWYLIYRLGGNSIGISKERKQRVVRYYDTLRMELCCSSDTLSYLRVLSKPSLDALRKVLGKGVGLGLTKKRPVKAAPVGCCTIGGLLTSIECDEEPPYEILLQPDHPCTTDGIDFIFYEKARCLSCTVRYSKLVVNDRIVATSRMPSAVVSNAVSGVYLNVWFLHNQNLLEVVAINDTTATCSYVEETNRDLIELPLELVTNLVARFGNN
jgi:hypothetical protein